MTATYIGSDAELLASATDGDEQAWEQIIGRYQPLVDAIARRHRLAPCDAGDVSQHVWLQLVDQAARLREPRALPGWIATTATRKCYEVLRSNKRAVSVDPFSYGVFARPDSGAVWAGARDAFEVDDDLLRAEQRRAVRQGLAELSETQQQLLLLLVADPPVSYAEIGQRMGLPLGSIGPTRARLLKKLGRTSAVRGLVEDRSGSLVDVA